MMTSFAILRRDPNTARTIEDILGLPNDRWSDVQVQFGNENHATATVELLLTGEQIVALAELAATNLAYPAVEVEDSPT